MALALITRGLGVSIGPTAPSGTDSAPTRLATVYCTDEDILLRAPQDFATLCPRSQVVAYGTDGVFAAGVPWTLTSATVDFSGLGVAANGVVRLSRPVSTYAQQGLLMAVNQVGTYTATLRRPGLALGVGQPPAPTAGLTSVEFTVLTFRPQIDVASFDANRHFGIDPNVTERKPSDLYDVRDLQQFVVLTVLKRAYIAAEKTLQGDFKLKLADVANELSDLKASTAARWGVIGQGNPASTSFSTRARR